MTNPWLALPGTTLHRALVRESWNRSVLARLDPERAEAPLEFSTDEVRDYRLEHPLATVLPVIRRLLVRDADDDSGVLVAVGDAMGRLLWVDGDQQLKRLAENMLFVEGASWAERSVGTSAPGTALALDHGVQIHGPEHFSALVHPWSCTAVPVHDPETRAIIGVLDITGGADAVAPQTLPLMEATAAAVESELLVQRLRAVAAQEQRVPRRRRPARAASGAAPVERSEPTPILRVLGRDTGELSAGGADPLALSSRHSEILTLLAWHRAGLSAEALAEALYGRGDAVVTLRSEMVRLRKVLEKAAPRLVPVSRPYRLEAPLDLDVGQVIGLLDRGAHRVALGAYSGPLLPGSEAPGIREVRSELAGRLREAMLESAAVDVLLSYAATPDALDDAEVWTAALRLLPPRSPRRAGVVAHLDTLDG